MRKALFIGVLLGLAASTCFALVDGRKMPVIPIDEIPTPVIPDSARVTITLNAGVARSLMALLDSGSPLDVNDAVAISAAIDKGFKRVQR